MEALLGRSLPSGAIGESWDVAAHANGVSVVDQGELAGKSLVELVHLYGSGVLGAKGQEMDGKFPLLKFIDACRTYLCRYIRMITMLL